MDTPETTAHGSVRHHFVGKKGDLRCELHYKDFATVSPEHLYCGSEAALYVFRASAPTRGVFVPMCQLWAFTYDPMAPAAKQIDGARTGERVAARARELAQALYGFATQSDGHRVLDLLCDYLGDLKDHRPAPGGDKTLDDFLAEVEEDTEGGHFFLEVNGERVIG